MINVNYLLFFRVRNARASQFQLLPAIFFLGWLATSRPMAAQTVIGGLTPDPSAMLDVQSQSQGVLFPRMTTAERNLITHAPTGLMIFNTTENRLQINLGTPGNASWQNINPIGTITGLDCAGAMLTGNLYSGQAASSVIASVPYTGGNGGEYHRQVVTSTGVTGLTATLLGGSFAFGAGNLSYAITGTPTSSGTATFTLGIGGQSCTLNATVEILGSIGSLTCASATLSGSLSSGQSASGVSVSIPYTGGNGGLYDGQTVTSTLITGLTATLSAGSFASGAGNLSYAITGTPAANGTATFALSIGGQSCTLNVTVQAPFSISCTDAIRKGEMQPNISYTTPSKVSIVVPYVEGAGAAHGGQIVTSTDVTGFTATLAAGNFASGSGTLIYEITGMSSSSGTAKFALNIGGSSCNLDLEVKTCSAKIDATTTKTFLCYNLGAYNTRASASVPSWEINGDYWRWGVRDSAAAGPTGSGAAEANDAAITGWNLLPVGGNTAWVDTNPMGNNPCPAGFRVPSKTQWDGVRNNNVQSNVGGSTWTSGSTNYTTGRNFGSNLFLPAAGSRDLNNGLLVLRGSWGFYWSSTAFGSYSWDLRFNSTGLSMNGSDRPYGFSIRCIQE